MLDNNDMRRADGKGGKRKGRRNRNEVRVSGRVWDLTNLDFKK